MKEQFTSNERTQQLRYPDAWGDTALLKRNAKWAADELDRQRAEVERLTADLASAHEQLADQTARWAAVVNERDALRARIDALMLEYCPDEMTADQTAEWARHQVPHQLSAAEREALERESAAVDAVATEPKRAYYETHEPPHCPTCGCGGAAAKREALERAPAAEES